MGKVDRRQIDYSGMSVRYDELRFAGRQNAYLETVRERAIIRGLGGVSRTSRVLDAGCGTGRGLLQLRANGFHDVTGVDFTEAMLIRGRENLATAGAPAAKLIRADAFRLPFADGSFDVVVSLNFLHMFRFDLQCELVGEFFRVCAPGGLVVVELESIHKGLFVTRYLEQRRVQSSTKFNSAREVKRMFARGRFARVRVRGTVLPKAYTVLKFVPNLGALVESIGYIPPFNWMSSRVVVSAERAGTVSRA